MNITYHIRLDLRNTGTRITLHAKQYDASSRRAEITLYDGGTAWPVPAEATILQIAYCKPDHTGGLYDTMPDNSAACSAAGNVVTVKLHPQMFTAAGTVACELRMLTAAGEQISTFTWLLQVEQSAVTGITSADYYRFASLDSLQAQIGTLAGLDTLAKSSLVAALNELYEREISAQDVSYPGTIGGTQVSDVMDALLAIDDVLTALQLSVESAVPENLQKLSDELDDICDNDTVAFPIVNSQDAESASNAMFTAYVQRSAAETAAAEGDVSIPSVGKMVEAISAVKGMKTVTQADFEASGAASIQAWAALEDPNYDDHYLISEGLYLVTKSGTVYRVSIFNNGDVRRVDVLRSNGYGTSAFIYNETYSIPYPGGAACEVLYISSEEQNIMLADGTGDLKTVSMPPIHASDEGKFLKVNSGEAKWESLPDYNGGEF